MTTQAITENKATGGNEFFADLLTAIDGEKRETAILPEMPESESLTWSLNRMIAAGASFEASTDDFQVSGADKLSESQKQFLEVNKPAILCTLQQGALVKYLFSQKPDTRQKFVSEVNRQGASFEAVCRITAEWFGRLLNTIQ